MKPNKLFFLLCLIGIPEYGIHGIKWFKPGNDEYTSVSGCKIELTWNMLIKEHTAIITKIEEPGHQLNNDERYVIHTTETEHGQDVCIVIAPATVHDSGVYRCTVEYTERHKDVNLTVIDFKWKSDIKSVFVREGEDINLEWKYDTEATFKYILVYRISSLKENSRKQYLGNLTADNSGERRVNRTSVIANKDGNGVILTLRKVTEEDVKYNYFIELVYSDTCSMPRGLTLLNKALKLYSQTSVIKVRRHEDINFVWNYEYISPVKAIYFKRKTLEDKIDEIGHWHDGKFLPLGESILKFNKTEENITNGIKGQITLTLLNASREDFNYDYFCHIIFDDKQESSWNILLEEETPQFVKDDSAFPTGAVAGIAVTVVVVAVILVLILVIVLSRQNESVRQKIQSCTEGNNADKKEGNNTNQAESIPLQESNTQE